MQHVCSSYDEDGWLAATPPAVHRQWGLMRLTGAACPVLASKIVMINEVRAAELQARLFSIADRPRRGQEFAGLHDQQAAVRLRQRLVFSCAVAVCCRCRHCSGERTPGDASALLLTE